MKQQSLSSAGRQSRTTEPASHCIIRAYTAIMGLVWAANGQFLDVFVAHHLCCVSLSSSSFCQSYDMKQHSTKVFRDIVNALGSFIQSLFIVPSAGSAAAVSAPAGQSQSLNPFIASVFESLFFLCSNKGSWSPGNGH